MTDMSTDKKTPAEQQQGPPPHMTVLWDTRPKSSATPEGSIATTEPVNQDLSGDDNPPGR